MVVFSNGCAVAAVSRCRGNWGTAGSALAAGAGCTLTANAISMSGARREFAGAAGFETSGAEPAFAVWLTAGSSVSAGDSTATLARASSPSGSGGTIGVGKEIVTGAGTARLSCSLGCCLASFAFRREPPAANPVAAESSSLLPYEVGRAVDACGAACVVECAGDASGRACVDAEDSACANPVVAKSSSLLPYAAGRTGGV